MMCAGLDELASSPRKGRKSRIMDIEWITDKAKEIFLEQKEFPPCLFVELDNQHMLILGVPQIAYVESSREKAHLNFMAGRTFQQKLLKKKATRKQQVTGACQVTESWFGYGIPTGKTSERPDRRECLFIVTIDVQSMEQQTQIYEILRDGTGGVDLVKESSPEPGIGYGLPCFLAGVRSANQDISQAIHSFRQTYEQIQKLYQERIYKDGA